MQGEVLHAAAGLQETLVVMHYLYLAITFAGIVTLVFASLVALERLLG